MPNIVNPPDASLEFVAPIRSLRLSAGAPIHFDFALQRLCIDRAPASERRLRPIDDVVVSHDRRQLSFTFQERARSNRVSIESDNAFHHVLFGCVAALQAHGCKLPDVPLDSVEINCEGQVMTSMILRRSTPDSVRQTLRVFREGDSVLRLVPVDAIRTKVHSLTASGAEVTCVSDHDTYVFALSLPEPLLGAVRELVNLGWTSAP